MLSITIVFMAWTASEKTQKKGGKLNKTSSLQITLGESYDPELVWQTVLKGLNPVGSNLH